MEASALQAPAGLARIAASGPLLRLRSDEQLVALFRAGSEEAFRTIHDRYRQRLLAYARQMLGGSRPDADDAMQDVFLRAYRALRADERPVALRAWLFRVAHNRCIDQLRRPIPTPGDLADASRHSLPDAYEAAQQREDLRRLVADLRGLPEQQRSALLLREMEGLSYAELGDALGTTIPAVKSLLVRARIGLVEAAEARDAACGEIRIQIEDAHDRGVRAGGRARRHMRDCDGCKDYRSALRRTRSGIAGLAPSPGLLGTLAKLLGIGGAGTGAAASGGVAAGGGATVVVGGGAATKVVAAVCCAAVVGGGAAEVRKERREGPARVRAAALPAVAAGASSAASGTAGRAALRAPDPPAAAAPVPEPSPPGARVLAVAPAPSAAAVPEEVLAPTAALEEVASDVEVASGGLAAPDEEGAGDGQPSGGAPGGSGDQAGSSSGSGPDAQRNGQDGGQTAEAASEPPGEQPPGR